MSLNLVMPIGSPYSTLHAGMVQAEQSIEKTAESIASGVNTLINPADSYVASGLNTNIRATHKAIENSQYGLNFTTVADSALNEITENLQRIREISIQAANNTYSQEQVAIFQSETNQNIEQIKQSFENATFNGKKTIDNFTPNSTIKTEKIDFFINANTSTAISYDPNIKLDSLNFDISTPESAQASIGKIDAMIGDINAKRSEIGTIQNKFEVSINQLTENITTASSALSSIQDTDYVSAITELKKSEFSMELMAKVMKTVMNSENYVLNLLK